MPLIGNNDMSVAAPLTIWLVVTQMQPRSDCYTLGLAQACHNSGFVDETVGRPYAAAEISLKSPNREVIRDQAEG